MEYRYDLSSGLFLKDLERMSPAQKRELDNIVDFWSSRIVDQEGRFFSHYIPRDNKKRSLPHLITISDRFSDDPLEQLQIVVNESYHHLMRSQTPIFNWCLSVMPLRSGNMGVLEAVNPLRLRNRPSNLYALSYRYIGSSEY